ncbi:hypothetical protein BC332_20693 [Capsicum chinense]|nr:hypothetical protein BC332_20693 [Capsicum chinense]
MAEEFQESDVLFGQNNDEVVQKSADEDSNDEADEQLVDEEEPKECGFQIRRNNINLPRIREVTMKPNSSSIPVNASWLKYVDDVNDDDKDELVGTSTYSGCKLGCIYFQEECYNYAGDLHEGQVQFALGRGVPAVMGVLCTIKSSYSSRAFDMVHCSRCLIPWGADGMFSSHLIQPIETNLKLKLLKRMRQQTKLEIEDKVMKRALKLQSLKIEDKATSPRLKTKLQ